MPIFGAAYAAPNKDTTILYWFRSLSTVLSPTENRRIQGLYKLLSDFPVLFKTFKFQVLYKKALEIQVLFKPVGTLSIMKMYHTYPKYSGRQAYAYSVNPDPSSPLRTVWSGLKPFPIQTLHQSHLIWKPKGLDIKQICMGESSKFQKSWTLEIPSSLKTCSMPTKYWPFPVSLDKLRISQRSCHSLPIQHFEADFLWKVSLKVLNSGLILKTFTHEYGNYRICPYKCTSCRTFSRFFFLFWKQWGSRSAGFRWSQLIWIHSFSVIMIKLHQWTGWKSHGWKFSGLFLNSGFWGRLSIRPQNAEFSRLLQVLWFIFSLS